MGSRIRYRHMRTPPRMKVVPLRETSVRSPEGVSPSSSGNSDDQPPGESSPDPVARFPRRPRITTTPEA